MEILPRERIGLYGQVAFASVVLVCYLQLTLNDLQLATAAPWQIVAVFAAGMAYSVLFAVSGEFCERRGGGFRTAYYVVQCLLVTCALFTSPSRGFFGIIGLPLVAQAILDFGWRGAGLVTLWTFASGVAVFVIALGPAGLGRAALSYIPIYLFVIVFSVVSKQALTAKQDAERLSRELAAANEKLRAQAAAVAELATTRERNRVAREIHDGVGHYLTVIKTQLDAAAALLPAEPQRAAGSVEKAARLAGEALEDVRRSVGTLAADVSRPPLVDTLRQLAAEISPPPEFRIEGTPRALPGAAEHALYRTAQEGLTNVRKHAAATTAMLTLDFRNPACVRLVVTDNGHGLSAPRGNELNGAGYGLRGLAERLALLGGKVSAQNRPEGGFSLVAEVPA
jgi:signal transduction histidine kinase